MKTISKTTLDELLRNGKTTLFELHESGRLSRQVCETMASYQISTIDDLVLNRHRLLEMWTHQVISGKSHDKLRAIIKKYYLMNPPSDNVGLLKTLQRESFHEAVDMSSTKTIFLHYFRCHSDLLESIKLGVDYTLGKLVIRDRPTQIKLRKVLLDYVEKMITKLSENPSQFPCALDIYSHFMEEFRPRVDVFTCKEKYQLFCNAEVRSKMEFFYQDYCKKYLTEEQQQLVRQHFPHFETLLPYLDSSPQRTAFIETSELPFSLFFLLLSRNTKEMMDQQFRYDEKKHTFVHDGYYFPFLSAEDLDFVTEFEKKYKRLPYFFLALHEMQDLASHYDICEVSVEHFLRMKAENQQKFEYTYFSEQEFASLYGSDHFIVDHRSPEMWKKLMEIEHLDISVETFWHLYAVMTGLSLEKIAEFIKSGESA